MGRRKEDRPRTSTQLIKWAGLAATHHKMEGFIQNRCRQGTGSCMAGWLSPSSLPISVALMAVPLLTLWPHEGFP